MKDKFFLLVMLLAPSFLCGDWEIEVPYNDSSGISASIALSSGDEPHIVYFVGGDHSYHIYKSGGAWYGPFPIEEVNYFAYCRMVDIAMVRDTANVLMSIEYSGPDDYLLLGTHLGGGVWSIQQIPNTVVSSDAGGYVDVAISPGMGNSSFHLIYVHYNYGSPILYYRKYANGWTTAEIVSSVPDVSAGWQNDITVDANDDPHITFVYADEGVKYRKKSDGVWGAVELVSSTTDPMFTSIAVNDSNYPHVVYDKDDFGAVCYRAKAAGGWQSEQIIGVGGGWNTYGASVAIAGDQVFAAYYAQGDLKFAALTTSGWVAEDVDTAGDVGTYASLALDTQGYAHIAYCDAANERLKYAKSTEPVVGIVEEDSDPDAGGFALYVCPNPFHRFTDIRCQMTDGMEKCELTIYDIAGRPVAVLSEQVSVIGHQPSVRWDGTDNTGRLVPAGIYFVHITAGKTGDFAELEKVVVVR